MCVCVCVRASVTQLSFMVSVPAFGLARYTIRPAESNALHSIASVMLCNSLPSHYGKGSVLLLLLLLISSCQAAATSGIVKVLLDIIKTLFSEIQKKTICNVAMSLLKQ